LLFDVLKLLSLRDLLYLCLFHNFFHPFSLTSVRMLH
jgi:hypothetical protein